MANATVIEAKYASPATEKSLNPQQKLMRCIGVVSRLACLTMVFKLVQSAQKRWRALNRSTLIPEVITGVRFVDGVKQQAA